MHTVQHDGKLEELEPPSGGPWGGTLVDTHILDLLETLFGKPVLDEFKVGCKSDELELHRIIELTKRKFKGTGKVNMRIPTSLLDTHGDQNRVSIEEAISKSQFGSTIQKRRDRLQIQSETFLQQFDASKASLLGHVKELLKNRRLKNVHTLMMVGGFSECEIMKNAVKEAFPNKRVIVPEQAGIAVVKGI